MKHVDVNGGKVAYDLIGPEDGELLVLTPGGRFSMDYPGVRPLGEALAAGGMRVLLWDRPNCGRSDTQFFGKTESHMRADTLAGLLDELELGPAVIAGGSGGARDSMLFALMYPHRTTRLILWNIVGGVFGTVALASHYNVPHISAVRAGGMDAVAALPEYLELIENNPGVRDRLAATDPAEYERVMLRWMNAFVPKPGQTIPGIEDEDFEALDLPTLIIRGGAGDINHPMRTSLEMSTLIKGSTLADPPWPEDSWERACERRARGEGGIFDYWYTGAPMMLDFARGAA